MFILPSEYMPEIVFPKIVPIVPDPDITNLKGRKLSENDIGQRVFRITPLITQRSPFGFDNSFVPQSVSQIDANSIIFKGFIYEKGGYKLLFGNPFSLINYKPLDGDFNDGNWFSVSEAKLRLL